MFFIFVKYLESNIIAGSIPNIKKCFIKKLKFLKNMIFILTLLD